MKFIDTLVALLTNRISVLFVGPPGCAKTALMHLLGKLAGYDEVIVFRTSLAERVDLGGCYVPDLEKGTTVALPLELLQKLRTTAKKTLLVLDDLGTAPMDVQASCMSLFDVGNLSPTVVIWGATNRPGDKAGVTSLCEPLRSRFKLAYAMPTPGTEDKSDGPTLLCSWKDAVDNWCNWAGEKGFAPEIIAWHRSTTGRSLYQWRPAADPAIRMADFRSWETVCLLWEAGLRDMHSLSAAVGKAAAAEFLSFAALADKLPTPQQVWMDPHGAPVPDEVAAQYLISAMLARAVEPKYATQFVTYVDRLPRVMGAYSARDAFARLGAKLVGNKAWQEWWTKNQALFATG